MKEIEEGQTVNTVYDFYVEILDILPNTLIVRSDEEGIIILDKSDITEIIEDKE